MVSARRSVGHGLQVCGGHAVVVVVDVDVVVVGLVVVVVVVAGFVVVVVVDEVAGRVVVVVVALRVVVVVTDRWLFLWCLGVVDGGTTIGRDVVVGARVVVVVLVLLDVVSAAFGEPPDVPNSTMSATATMQSASSGRPS